MTPHRLLLPAFWFFLGLFPAFSQTFPASDWKLYGDGNQIRAIFIQDSIGFVVTGEGLAVLNTNTRQLKYIIHEPVFFQEDWIDLGRDHILWYINEYKLYSVDTAGNIELRGSVDSMPFYNENSTSTYDCITAFRVDRNGLPCVGMQRYYHPFIGTEPLARFNGVGWDLIDVGQTNMSVDDIAFDTLNRAWLAAVCYACPLDPFGSAGIFRWDGDSLLGFDVPSPDPKLVAHDADNAIWGVTPGHLIKVRDDSLTSTSFPLFDYDPYCSYVSTHVDSLGRIWKTRSHRIYQYTGGATALPFSDTLANYRMIPGSCVTAWAMDDQHRLWIGFPDGLYVLSDNDPSNWDFVPTGINQYLQISHLKAAASRHDTVWMGFSTGLSQFDGQNWTNLLPGVPISQLHYDTVRQGLWIGTGQKVLFFQNGQSTVYDLSPMLLGPSEKVETLMTDAANNLWAGTRYGIGRFDGNTWKAYNYGQELPDDFFRLDISIADTTLWIMTIQVGSNYPPVKLYKLGPGDTAEHVLNLPINLGRVLAHPDGSLWFSNDGTQIKYSGGGLEFFYANSSYRILPFFDGVMTNYRTVFNLIQNGAIQTFQPDIGLGRSFLTALYVEPGTNRLFYKGEYGLVVLENPGAILTALGVHDATPESPEALFRLYPNPGSNELFVKPLSADVRDQPVFAAFFHPEGRLARHLRVQTGLSLDVSGLPAGLYLVSLQTGDGSKLPGAYKFFKM